MQLIADGILVISALVAALYCMVLSRRLRKLTQTEGGLGAAIATMSRQADELREALVAARTANEESAASLRAEVIAANRARAELDAAVERVRAVALGPATQAAPVSTRPEGEDRPPSPGTAPAPEPAIGKVIPKVSASSAPKRAREPAGGGAPKLDGVISAYLDAHRGEDEEGMAQRLVAALTAQTGADEGRKP